MACFAQLRDNVPSWISDANQLSVHVYAKRAEFAEETKKLVNPPRKSISSLSTCSQRSSLPSSKSPRHGLKRILSRDSLRDSTKRRRVRESSPSPRNDLPAPVILYDGHTQKALEQMVRQIWSAKSSIRSSRIASSMQTALRGPMRMRKSTPKKANNTTSPLSTIEVDDGSLAPEDDLPDLRPIMKSTRPKESPYDFIEGQLDSAQNLCETAAYRFLREGNCLDELEGLVRTYELVLEAATTMAEQMAAEEPTEENTAATETVKDESREEIPESKRHNVGTNGADGPDELNAAILEVDERSETSEVSIDISAFRMTRYGQRTLHPFTLTRAAR